MIDLNNIDNVKKISVEFGKENIIEVDNSDGLYIVRAFGDMESKGLKVEGYAKASESIEDVEIMFNQALSYFK